MFAAVGSAYKERSLKDKKAEKKRKRQSDAAVLEKPTNGDSIATSKGKSKKPRIDSDNPSHIQPLDISLTPSKGPATASTTFKTVTTRLYLAISPLYSPHPWLSLESDHLDPLVLTYYPPLRGIILSYRNIRFNQRGARIQADSPFAFTWVTVDFLLWRPQKGDFLEGWVNLQSESHIGLLVLNTFNVSVPRGKIPRGWRWCEKRVGFTPAEVIPAEEGPKDTEPMEGVEGGEAEKMDGEGGEEEEAEEDLGGWMNEKGEYVDGLLRFKVETIKASGHIIAIEGNLLESEADAGQGNNTSNLGEVRELPIRPVEVTRGANGVTEIATSVDEEAEVEADVEQESLVKERKKEKERKREKKEKKKKSKKDKDS
ncbi:hypothetical protein EV426DRAFT_590423 [Tirmania nivea]|nr:hypothetical protein EV426DRAFT_590423 [Tirmania nivea]